jgi:hypothetical protein
MARPRAASSSNNDSSAAASPGSGASNGARSARRPRRDGGDGGEDGALGQGAALGVGLVVMATPLLLLGRTARHGRGGKFGRPRPHQQSHRCPTRSADCTGQRVQ